MPLLLALAAFVGIYLTAYPALAAETLAVEVHERKNFSQADARKVDTIVALMSRIVNTDEFREGVLNFETCLQERGNACIRSAPGFHFRSTDIPYTRTEVWTKILAGSENFHLEPRYTPPPGNGVIDLFLHSIWKSKNTIGYTYPGRRTVYLNERYLDSRSAGYIGGNLVHEWMHKLGFTHASKPTALREYSVPYGIGNLVRKIAKDLTGETFKTEAVASSDEWRESSDE